MELTEQQITFTLLAVEARSVEEGDCRIYTGYNHRRAPYATIPNPGGKHRYLTVSLRRLLLTEIIGKQPPAGNGRYVPVATCGTEGCVELKHLKWITDNELARMTLERTGSHLNPARNAKVSRARAEQRKLTDSQVEEIRLGGKPDDRWAKELNVSYRTVKRARLGLTYKSYAASPWAGLGA